MSFLQEKAKFRMMKQEGSDKKNSYWDNLWGKQKDYQSSGTGNVKLQSGYKLQIIGNYKIFVFLSVVLV